MENNNRSSWFKDRDMYIYINLCNCDASISAPQSHNDPYAMEAPKNAAKNASTPTTPFIDSQPSTAATIMIVITMASTNSKQQAFPLAFF